METALHSILLIVPQAAAIWLTMLLVVAVVATALMLPRRISSARPERSGPGSENDDSRYADEVAIAADRAAATALRHREEWERARQDVDAAWARYDAADREARRLAAASAFPVLSRRRRPGENADRERYLHHAATAACRRHEISIGQLNEVLAHRGWNARLYPAAQEAALRNAAREHRFAAYRAATAREREAWRTADSAAAALRSLRAEALAARVRATSEPRSEDAQWWADQWTTTEPIPVVALASTVDGRHPIAA